MVGGRLAVPVEMAGSCMTVTADSPRAASNHEVHKDLVTGLARAARSAVAMHHWARFRRAISC